MSEIIKNKYCKNCNDAIFWNWKKIFLESFIKTIWELVYLNTDYYISLIEKIQSRTEFLDIEEYAHFKKLLDDKIFLEKAFNTFQQKLLMTREYFQELEKNSINIENLRNELLKYLGLNVIKNLLDKTQNDVWKLLEENSLLDQTVIYENDHILINSDNMLSEYCQHILSGFSWDEKKWIIKDKSSWNIIFKRKKDENKDYDSIPYLTIDKSYIDKWFIFIIDKDFNFVILNDKWEFIKWEWENEPKKFNELKLDFLSQWIIIDIHDDKNIIYSIKNDICKEEACIDRMNCKYSKDWFLIANWEKWEILYKFNEWWVILKSPDDLYNLDILRQIKKWQFIWKYIDANWKKKYIILEDWKILYSSKKEIYYDPINWYHNIVFWVKKDIKIVKTNIKPVM